MNRILTSTLAAAALAVGPLAASAGPLVNPAKAAAIPVSDVRIADGVLTGTLRDAAGTPVDGALVVVSQRGIELARTTTDRDGRYSLTGLQAGQYTVASGSVDRVVRLWETGIAPPKAADSVALAGSAGAARGNGGTALLGGFGASGVATTAAVVGAGVGIGLGVEAQDDVEHLEHENRVLRDELDALDDAVSAQN